MSYPCPHPYDCVDCERAAQKAEDEAGRLREQLEERLKALGMDFAVPKMLREQWDDCWRQILHEVAAAAQEQAHVRPE